MAAKTRVWFSVVAAAILALPAFLRHPESIVPLVFFAFFLFLSVYVASSLWNIHSTGLRTVFLSILFLYFALSLYRNHYLKAWALDKALVTSALSVGVFALFLRGVSLFLERRRRQ